MSADVLTNLYGRLGNQLFQYVATVRALRETGGSSFDLLMTEGRQVEIAEFLDVHPRVPTRRDRASWVEHSTAPGPLRPVFRRCARLQEARTDRVIVRQTSPIDVAVPMLPGAQMKLQGLFQHPSWFLDDWATVADDLLQRAPAGFADLVESRSTVVHVRRGDYVDIGWSLGPDYYLACLPQIAERTDIVTVVSDEPSFVPWFTKVASAVGVGVRQPDRMDASPERSDFYTIAAACTVIAANSTFSWWAAVTATVRDPRVRVFYPTPWIVSRLPAPFPDMGLPRWTCVPSGLPEFE